MRFKLNVTGANEISARLSQMPDSIDAILVSRMRELGEFIADYVRNTQLSGTVLHPQSGKLRDSIISTVSQAPGVVKVIVGSEGVAYAAIQERGGTTRPHTIYPNVAQALAFYWMGKWNLFRMVNHPGSNITATNYLRNTLEVQSGTIRSMIADALNEGIARA
jgi:phage gpG-like protein